MWFTSCLTSPFKFFSWIDISLRWLCLARLLVNLTQSKHKSVFSSLSFFEAEMNPKSLECRTKWSNVDARVRRSPKESGDGWTLEVCQEKTKTSGRGVGEESFQSSQWLILNYRDEAWLGNLKGHFRVLILKLINVTWLRVHLWNQRRQIDVSL